MVLKGEVLQNDSLPRRICGPSPPPRVIETEGALRKGEVGGLIDAYLVLDTNYAEWWASHTYGPLVGPIEGGVSFFTFPFLLHFSFMFICDFY